MQWIGYVDPADHENAVSYMKAMRGNFQTPSDSMIEMYISGLSDNLGWMKNVLKMENPGNFGHVEFKEMPGAGSIQTMTGDSQFGGNGLMYFSTKRAVTERDENIDVWYQAPAVHLIQDPETKNYSWSRS